MRQWLTIPPEEYFQLPAYGSGAMRSFATEGQFDFYYKYVQRQRDDSDSDAKRLGRAFHAAMESETGWVERFTRVPTHIEDDEFVAGVNSQVGGGEPLKLGVKLNLKFPSHRAYLQAHQDRAARLGNDFMTAEEFTQVARQVAAVYDNPACRDLLAEKREYNVESTCLFTHESGIDLKALCDLTLYEAVADFKTTRKRNKDDFIRDAWNNGYDWQAGHYCLVTGKNQFFFVSITNSPPYEANVFEVPRRVIGARKRDIERQCVQLAQLLADRITDTDSQGIPLAFHNELWGSIIPLELEQRR